MLFKLLKNWFAFIAVAIVTACNTGNNEDTDATVAAGYIQADLKKYPIQVMWKDFEFKGKVKVLEHKEWDASGQPVKVVKGKLSCKIRFNFNDNGFLLKHEQLLYNDTEENSSVTFHYDSTGTRPVSNDNVESDGAGSNSVYAYNSMGQIISETTYYATPTTVVRYFTYDKDGNLASTYSLAYNDTVKYTYTYDGKGRLATSKYTDPRGNMRWSAETWSTDGTNCDFVRIYISKGDTVANSTIHQAYNKYSDMLSSVVSYAGKTDTYVIHYKYDASGNWTQKITVLNDTVSKVQERVIEYY